MRRIYIFILDFVIRNFKEIELYFISKIDVFWNNLYILVMCLKFEFF